MRRPPRPRAWSGLVGGEARWCRGVPVPALAIALAVILVSGCGSTGPPPPWRSGHPNPSSLSLLDSAQAGSCASTAPDPNQAPAAITFQGQEYVQSSRQSASASAPNAVEIDHSGDWSFWVTGNDLLMDTPQAEYLYSPGNC
jgi:hypothetical protein